MRRRDGIHGEFLNAVDEIEKSNTQGSCSSDRSSVRSPSKMKPKQHRTTRYELARTRSKLVSAEFATLPFSSPARRLLTNKLRAAVEKLTRLETRRSRARSEGAEESETRGCRKRTVIFERTCAAHSESSSSKRNVAQLHRVAADAHIVERGEAEAESPRSS